MVSKTFTDKETGIIYYELPEPCDARFLIMASEGGKIVEINHFEIVGNCNGGQKPPICNHYSIFTFTSFAFASSSFGRVILKFKRF